MKDFVKIYSFSNYLAQINNYLAGDIQYSEDFSLSFINLSEDHQPVIILFDWENFHNLKNSIKSINMEEVTLICVDDDISPENRLYLLNNNIEFITNNKFSKLTKKDFLHWAHHNKYKVLIIENNQYEALNFSSMLKKANIQVKTIGLEVTVRDAVNIFDPDLVLVIINDKTNSEISTVINSAKSKSPGLPVLFLNSDSSIQSRQVLTNMGISQVLSKPVNEDVFLDTVFDLIQGKVLKFIHSSDHSETKTRKHTIIRKSHSELNEFILSNGISNYSAVIWLKISNKFSIQRKVGLSAFKDIFETFISQLPDFDVEFSLKQRITDGVIVLACKKVTRQQIIEYIQNVKNWLANNIFSINNKEILCNVQAYVLTDISAKSNKGLLSLEAEKMIINNTHSEDVLFVAESEERKNFYLTKTKLINAIRDKSFKWLYQSILGTKNNDIEVLQIMIRVITGEGKELKSLDYFNVANETGLLKLLDRYTLKHAIAVIIDGESKNINRHILLNQLISDYESESHRADTLASIEKHNIPEHRLIFQFRQDMTEDYISELKDIGNDLNNAGISVCISEFDSSEISWDIAKKLDARWIRLKPFDMDSEVLHRRSPHYLGNTIKKAHQLGYKVIVPNIDSADFTAHIWNLNADFIHGNFVQSPVSDIRYIES